MGHRNEEYTIPQPLDLIHILHLVCSGACMAQGASGRRKCHVCDDRYSQACKANDHPLTRAYNIKDPRIEDSLYGEILAYDNFEAEMDVISFSALLRPRPDFPDPRPGFPESRPPGLLDLCAFLKYNEAEMKEAEEQACRSKDKRLGLKSRMKKFRERRFGDFEVLQVKPQDRRVKAVHKWTLQQGKCAGPFPMSPWELKDFYRLVKPFKPDFRLPMLVSLLSLMTRKWKQDSMEEQVIHKIQGHFVTRLCPEFAKYLQKKKPQFEFSSSIIRGTSPPCCQSCVCSRR